MNSDITWTEVRRRLDQAAARFLANDSHLLIVNANERSMTHRFAIYLEGEFAGFSVDCEYNRKGALPKELHIQGGDLVPQNDEDARTVFPDITVHQRGEPSNLLVIEAKKRGGNNERDRRKLAAFISEDAYRYRFGVLLLFITGEHPDISIEQYLPER